MHSLRRIAWWLVISVVAGLLPACATGKGVEPTGAPAQQTDLDPRLGITVDRFSGQPIRGGGTR
jgi:hypothetical protein